MSCPLYITDLAQQIWYAIGSPSGQPPQFIQSRLLSQTSVGELNNLLTTCYESVSGVISPPLGNTEQSIYSAMYQANYYGTRLNQTLAGVNPGVVSIQDGDSRLVLTSPVEVARLFRDMQKQAFDEMMTLVYAYRQQASQPSAVDLPTIINAPGAWGGMGGGYSPAQYPYGYYRS